MANILIVDDDPINRLLLATVLIPLGHDIREATDGEQALRSLAASMPDLIVLDLSMPNMGGAAFLRALRRDLGSDTRVVLSTATRPDAAMHDFVRLFAIADVLEKPSEPSEIVRIVARALERPLPSA